MSDWLLFLMGMYMAIGAAIKSAVQVKLEWAYGSRAWVFGELIATISYATLAGLFAAKVLP